MDPMIFDHTEEGGAARTRVHNHQDHLTIELVGALGVACLNPVVSIMLRDALVQVCRDNGWAFTPAEPENRTPDVAPELLLRAAVAGHRRMLRMGFEMRNDDHYVSAKQIRDESIVAYSVATGLSLEQATLIVQDEAIHRS